ncbi:uncharacterized protein LOC143464337 [Clavelina lepadiformis]|uniref:uncharacterized protein LOC143464337 n=1 Tax=Clavelina lepadiformis TaxID=159417 RepID=UPI0040420FEF
MVLDFDAILGYLVFLFFCIELNVDGGFLNIEELKEQKYVVDILQDPINAAEVNLSEGLQLASKHGQNYFCKFPEKVLKMAGQTDTESRLPSSYPITKLLESLKEEPCMKIVNGWWTYELCYGKEIQQYHSDDGVPSGDIISLGNFESDFDWNDEKQIKEKMFKRSHVQRYHTQYYTNGTKCDVINHKRDTEIRYYCDESATEAYIERVDEPSTCSYIITVRTHILCPHPHTRLIAASKSYDIVCQPMLSSSSYNQYHDRLSHDALRAYEEANALLKEKRNRLLQLLLEMKKSQTQIKTMDMASPLSYSGSGESFPDTALEQLSQPNDQYDMTKEKAIGFIERFAPVDQVLTLSDKQRAALFRDVVKLVEAIGHLPTADMARMAQVEIITFFERQVMSSPNFFTRLVEGLGLDPSTIEDQIDKTNLESDDDVRIKVRHYQAGKEPDVEDDELDIDEVDPALKKFEDELTNELKAAGFSFPSRIEVHLVTNTKDGEQRSLTETEAQQFKDMLLDVMGGSSKEEKAKERYSRIENTYSLVFEDSDASFESKNTDNKKHSSTSSINA